MNRAKECELVNEMTLTGGHLDPTFGYRPRPAVLRSVMNGRQPATAPAITLPALLGYDDLARHAGEPTRWLWHGYLAAGAVTLLTSRWKAGKTTLLSVLLARMGAGGELAGLSVAVVDSSMPNSIAPWLPTALT